MKLRSKVCSGLAAARGLVFVLVMLSGFWASEVLAQDAPPIVTPLTSRHVAVSWVTGSLKFAQVEYSRSPFAGPDSQGTIFPTSSLSPTGYTRVSSRTHDLCLADLEPDTSYFVRVRTIEGSNARSSVSAAVAVRTRPAPVPTPASEFTSNGWVGLYATDQWMVNKAIRVNLMAIPYARGATVGAAWNDIEPAQGAFDFGVIDQALLDLQAGGKYVKLELRGTSNIDGARIPDWVPDGVETIVTKSAEQRSVKWDPAFACRWWQFVTAYGSRYDASLRGRLGFVNVSGVGSAEMATVKATLDAYRSLGYTDRQLEANFLWAWRTTLEVFAETFPHARLSIVPGSIPLTNRTDLGSEIVKQAVETYGARLVLAHSGFSLEKTGFAIGQLLRYRDRVWIGGLTEQPRPDAADPVAVLQPLFEGLVFPNGFDFVTLHSDALGINPTRWGNLRPLKDFLSSAEAQLAF